MSHPILTPLQDPTAGALSPCHDQLQFVGLLNITSPTAVTPWGLRGSHAGPPIFASLPHFCACDPALAGALVGLQCDTVAHMTTVDVEPTTGDQWPGSTALQQTLTCSHP